jgi:diaminohydroxyphosphoribosylaminopyrimidine deaminase / 5-amino-6-(5-phosphoribosylamino)uracil reductase
MPSTAATDERFMREALALAEERVGLTSPNPAVGCVLVRGGRIVGRGATAPGGRPHGEVQALKQAGARARGATAYVTFEPCAHHGQTPPCARTLVEAGITRAVVATIDPYPPVRGRGLALLKKAGIATTIGVLEAEARRVNEGFITRVMRKRPFGLLKLAMSIDGRIATEGGDSKWLSSEESRAIVHRWRRECDAVLVGAGTVLADNPRLTCRVPGGRDPVRVIVDARLRTSPNARMFFMRSKASTIIVTTVANLREANLRYRNPRVESLAMPDLAGEIDLAALMAEFARRGWNKVLIEGGARTAASVLAAGIVDRIAFFVAPRIIGGGTPAVEGLGYTRVRDSISVENLSVKRVGSDLLLEAAVSPHKSRSRRDRR